MSNIFSEGASSLLDYFKLRLQLPSVQDPVQYEVVSSRLEAARASSVAVSVFAALWDIQVRYPAVYPLILLSLVLKFFF